MGRVFLREDREHEADNHRRLPPSALEIDRALWPIGRQEAHARPRERAELAGGQRR